MIVTKPKQLYYKQKGSEIGYINREIYGNGIFTDTTKRYFIEFQKSL